MFLVLSTAVVSCGGSGGGDSGYGATGIPDGTTAQLVMENIYLVSMNNVINSAPTGSSINATVSGKSGTATVTGKNDHVIGISAGAQNNLIKVDITDVDVMIKFNAYKSQSMSNITMTLNGTVKLTYLYDIATYTSGSYTTYKSINIQNSTEAIQFEMDIYDYSDPSKLTSAYQDTIMFTASGSNEAILSGNCTATGGTYYY
jgi:hypothetical protein